VRADSPDAAAAKRFVTPEPTTAPAAGSADKPLPKPDLEAALSDVNRALSGTFSATDRMYMAAGHETKETPVDEVVAKAWPVLTKYANEAATIEVLKTIATKTFTKAPYDKEALFLLEKCAFDGKDTFFATCGSKWNATMQALFDLGYADSPAKVANTVADKLASGAPDADSLAFALLPLLTAHLADPQVIDSLKKLAELEPKPGMLPHDQLAFDTLEKADFPDKKDFFLALAPKRIGAAKAVLDLGYPEGPGIVARAMTGAVPDIMFAATLMPLVLLVAHSDDPQVIEAMKRIAQEGTGPWASFLQPQALAVLKKVDFAGKREFFCSLAAKSVAGAQALCELGYPDGPSMVANLLADKLTSDAPDKGEWAKGLLPVLDAHNNDSQTREVLVRIAEHEYEPGQARYDKQAFGILERADFGGKKDFFMAWAPKRPAAAEALVRLGHPGSLGLVADEVAGKLASGAPDKDSFARTFFPIMEAHRADPQVIAALKKIAAMSFTDFPYDTRALLALDKVDFAGKKEFLAQWEPKRKAAARALSGIAAPDSCDAGRLSDTQLFALTDAYNHAVDLSNQAREALLKQLTALGFTAADLDTCVSYMRDKAPITVNFDPDKSLAVQTTGFAPRLGLRVERNGSNRLIDSFLVDPDYRNQFETGITGGSNCAIPGGARDTWERTIFDGDYQTGPFDPTVRPKYGSVNARNIIDGGAPSYGSCCFVLKPSVRNRVTITPQNSSCCGRDDVGTLDDCMHVLLKKSNLQDIVKAAINSASAATASSFTCGFDFPYIEMQVHGPLELCKDVDLLVADPKYRGTPYEAKLRDLCARDGIKLMWKSDADIVADSPCAAPVASAPTATTASAAGTR